MKASLFLIIALISQSALANGYTAHCGPYTIVASEGEMDVINGERVTSQKITNLGADGIKINMGLMPAKDGNNYGFQYIHQPGSESRFLNVQLLQHNMDAPKLIGSYPCVKIN